jgi:hypothetical protein
MRLTDKVFLPAALPAGIICFLVYLKAVACGFVLWDDTEFVMNNVVIRQFDTNLFVWSFTTIAPFSGIWIPLTWVSFAVDYQFWGLNPLGYHLTNIILHSANVMVVILIANCLCQKIFLEKNLSKPAVNITLILVGLFFGIHPLRVESVAWVTERKDVLNGLFTFSSILFYLKYVFNKMDCYQGYNSGHYILSIMCFIFSLMAKPVSVVLPVMLLVADWYLYRFGKNYIKSVLKEKIPFFIVAVSVTFLTLYIASGKEGLLVNIAHFPLLERISASGNAVMQYLRFILIPVGIVQYAPLPSPVPLTYLFYSSVVIMLAVAVFMSRNRTLISTTLCFLLPLIPTLAFFQNNDHAYAARYTYLPMAIPSIAIVVSITLAYRKLMGGWKQIIKRIIVAVTVATLFFYVLMTEKLIGTWKDTGTFWSRIIEVDPRGRAYQERGIYYYGKGEYSLAIEDLTKAIEIAFSLGIYDRYNLNAFRGEACRRVHRYTEAVKEFTFAISKAPHPVYFYHRGLALRALGRIDEATEDFNRAGADTGPIDWY